MHAFLIGMAADCGVSIVAAQFCLASAGHDQLLPTPSRLQAFNVPGVQVAQDPANLDVLQSINPSFMLCGDLNSDVRHGIPGGPPM